MQVGRLSAVTLKTKPTGYHSDGGGLVLQVTAKGARTWLFRYRAGKKIRELGLGPLHTVTLAQARIAATECRRQRLLGADPIEVRKSERGAAAAAVARSMTFDDCAAAYIAAQEAAWRNAKHRAQWAATLKAYASPVIGVLPVHEVDQNLILMVLEPLWQTKTETASRLRGRIEKVLDYARSRGLRAGENPAQWKGHLALHLPQPSKVTIVEHHSALPYAELGDFMVKLRAVEGVGALALEFTILTAARTGETIGAEWTEIDLAGKVWTVPAARMKAGKEHRVPLSSAAMAVLAKLPREGQFVFPGGRIGKPLSNMAMTAVLRRMNRSDLTTHGMRSCFRDWTAEQTSFPTEMAEMALAHTVGDKVEAAYRRGDMLARRSKMMEAWAEFANRSPSSRGQIVASKLYK